MFGIAPLLGLVETLIAHLHIRSTLICLGEDQIVQPEEILAFDTFVGFVHPHDVTTMLSSMAEPPNYLLVICDDIIIGDQTNDLERSLFGEGITWLLPEKSNLDYPSMGLRLDSNVLVHSEPDSFGQISLTEVYSVKNETTIRGEYGTYSENAKKLVTGPSKWNRRTNLEGVSFINTGMQWDPLIVDSASGNPKGLMIDMLRTVTDRVNLTLEYVEPPDRSYGSLE